MSILTDLLKVDYPIVQAPMLGVTTPEMVAAVANSGALGSLPLGGLSPEKARSLIEATKALTDKPFAVNLFSHDTAITTDEETIDQMQLFLERLCTEYGVPYKKQIPDSFRFYSYKDLVDMIIESAIPIVSFTFGQLDANVILAFKLKGIILIGTATSVAEAKVLAEIGVDVITVQGIEAGGHRGTFLDHSHLPEIGLSALLPQVAAEVDVPLIAAGGIYNSETIQSAFALGASGVQIGSLFIPAEESAASETYKKAVLNATDASTKLTRAFTGRWARGISNEFMHKVESSGLTLPYYTIQNQLTAAIRTYAQQNGVTELIALWAGQSAGKSEAATTQEIIKKLINSLPKS